MEKKDHCNRQTVAKITSLVIILLVIAGVVVFCVLYSQKCQFTCPNGTGLDKNSTTLFCQRDESDIRCKSCNEGFKLDGVNCVVEPNDDDDNAAGEIVVNTSSTTVEASTMITTTATTTTTIKEPVHKYICQYTCSNGTPFDFLANNNDCNKMTVGNWDCQDPVIDSTFGELLHTCHKENCQKCSKKDGINYNYNEETKSCQKPGNGSGDRIISHPVYNEVELVEICKTDPKFDLHIVVDSSGSIGASGEEDWENVLLFIKRLTNLFDFGPDKTRVSLMNYANAASADYKGFVVDSKEKFTDSLESLNTVTPDGSTYTYYALKDLYEKINNENSQRADARNFVLLITDGNPSDSTKENVNGYAKKFRDDNTTIFAIGIKKFTQAYAIGELHKVASEPVEEYTYKIHDFNVLNEIKQKLLNPRLIIGSNVCLSKV